MNYPEAIDWLYGTQLFGIKLGLENVRGLAADARVDVARPAIIHVAGTNGKGSACAMAESILLAAGKRTGLFTSPHLVQFTERIRIDGREVSQEECAAGLTELRRLAEARETHPTFFEIATVLGLRCFRDAGVDVVVLETGMGGRLDATNIVAPVVTAITSISLDHAEWLGDSIAAIASEKAGIIKDGVPVVCAPQQPEAEAVIAAAARQREAPLVMIDAPVARDARLGLAGPHQRWNAAVAAEAVRQLRDPAVSEKVILRGLAEVAWRGRFQRFGPGGRLVVDGAHNPGAAHALAAAWRETFGTHCPATLVFGAVASKDVVGVLRQLRPVIGKLVLTPVDSPRSSTVEELAAAAGAAGVTAEAVAADDCEAALQIAADGGGPVLVAGSLFLAGQAIAILEHRGEEFEASAQ